MADPADLNGVLFRVDEKQPIVADAKAHFLKTLQALQISRAGFGETVKGIENPHSGRLIENADIGFGLIRPKDPLQTGSLRWLSISA